MKKGKFSFIQTLSVHIREAFVLLVEQRVSVLVVNNRNELANTCRRELMEWLQQEAG